MNPYEGRILDDFFSNDAWDEVHGDIKAGDAGRGKLQLLLDSAR